MFGNGVSGVATNALGMLFLAIFPGKSIDENSSDADKIDARKSKFSQSLYFFISSALVILLCAYSFTVLMKNEFFRYYKEQSAASARILPEFGVHGTGEKTTEEILKIRD